MKSPQQVAKCAFTLLNVFMAYNVTLVSTTWSMSGSSSLMNCV
ncbi:hypothetical protein [Candidatus Flexifilum breve]